MIQTLKIKTSFKSVVTAISFGLAAGLLLYARTHTMERAPDDGIPGYTLYEALLRSVLMGWPILVFTAVGFGLLYYLDRRTHNKEVASLRQAKRFPWFILGFLIVYIGFRVDMYYETEALNALLECANSKECVKSIHNDQSLLN